MREKKKGVEAKATDGLRNMKPAIFYIFIGGKKKR